MKKTLFALIALFAAATAALPADYLAETLYSKTTGTNIIVPAPSILGTNAALGSKPLLIKTSAPTLAVQVTAQAAAANSANVVLQFRQSVNGKDFVTGPTTVHALSGTTANSTVALTNIQAGIRYLQLYSIANTNAAGGISNITVTAGYFH